ncbi:MULTISPECIES: adenine phosphoribosyltransferase [Xanthomonas]|uniref:Adenine phosphoribosyltransferase n=1 Tax=Xanthomonas sacchari TaxID=56458 RepID=A0AA46SPG8_9XANT|nr:MULTISPECIES: adenine phosphoribosyltransferase [Xanthomonas]KAA8919833.1 adenine phosphoribosyltransferase [Xanthomonas sontii]MCW0366297.1 Adenine phosphoribosyltransferase [Xanthomonas sacchari]MCW0371373.1 Adenine phosphoribosyltransferase [Xanthomonas sacchari]MCW0390355.1 Adenine phosphoribosyltransferase [Xanthomonas sacchari]MCW0395119.1 Adenine phosphoribosyltransferase [Xanthomonas sacchari]
MNDSSCCGAPSDAPAHWSGRIRDIADFPKPGIVFKDITPLLADGPDFASALDEMARPWRTTPLQAVLGIESRGFILGAALAHELRTGFVPVRKPGKLPGRTVTQEYALEYGSDRIEMHADALPAGSRVLLVDDVLATGGTLRAALALAQQLELEVVGAAVLVELQALRGRDRWSETLPLLATLTY